jgi:hypothetical protein
MPRGKNTTVGQIDRQVPRLTRVKASKRKVLENQQCTADDAAVAASCIGAQIIVACCSDERFSRSKIALGFAPQRQVRQPLSSLIILSVQETTS